MDAREALFANIQANADTISPVSIANDIDEEEQKAHEEAKAMRKAVYMSNCGSFAYRMDAATGRFRSYKIACGYWRDGCPICLERREDEFRARFTRCKNEVEGSEFLGIAEVSTKESKNIVRKLRRGGSEYWRIPMANGNVLVIFDSFHFRDFSNRTIAGLDWASLSQTPTGKRFTGKLGRLTKEKKEGLLVEVPQYVFELPDNVDPYTTWCMAKTETKHLNPGYDAEDIENACEERMNRFVEMLIEKGGEVLDKMKVKMRVAEGDFGWIKSSSIETIEPDLPPGFVPETPIDDISLIFDY